MHESGVPLENTMQARLKGVCDGAVPAEDQLFVA